MEHIVKCSKLTSLESPEVNDIFALKLTQCCPGQRTVPDSAHLDELVSAGNTIMNYWIMGFICCIITKLIKLLQISKILHFVYNSLFIFLTNLQYYLKTWKFYLHIAQSKQNFVNLENPYSFLFFTPIPSNYYCL